MSPFTIDVPRARAYSPSSSLSSSPASSGIYVPIHKRRSAVSPAPSTASSSFSSTSSTSSHCKHPATHRSYSQLNVPSIAHMTYTREDLLMLASSPLSRQPLDHKLVQTFPTILKENGREIQRALNMSKGLPTRPRRHGKRSRKSKNSLSLSEGSSTDADASSSRHDSDEEGGLLV